MYYYLPMARTDPQLNLRLPAPLKDKLDEAAETNNRSLTAEVVERLTASFSLANNSALLTSVIATTELRAIGAEFREIELKQLVMELTMSLVAARHMVAGSNANPDPGMQYHLDFWQKAIDEAKHSVADPFRDGGSLIEESKKKLKEMTDTVERARNGFDEVASQLKASKSTQKPS